MLRGTASLTDPMARTSLRLSGAGPPGRAGSAAAGGAASVDATGASVAHAGVSTAAAGADHTAYAEAAHAPNGKLKRKKPLRKGTHDSNEADTLTPVPPGRRPLPENGADFIESLHAGADFAHIGVKLLNSADEKIVKSVWERMLDIKYGESGVRDDAPAVIFGGRGPTRD
jgi:hypothetical protein